MPKRRFRTMVGAMAAVAAMVLVLAYGYWRTTTHAWLVIMVSDSKMPGLPRAERISLRFLDAQQRRLAAAYLDHIGELFFENAPPGDCNALARLAHQSRENQRRWRQCSLGLSRWVSDWATRTRSLEVHMDGCPPRRLAAGFHTLRDEWWLWWVPLPHVGGLPSTTHQLDLVVDTATCEIRLRTFQGIIAATRS